MSSRSLLSTVIVFLFTVTASAAVYDIAAGDITALTNAVVRYSWGAV